MLGGCFFDEQIPDYILRAHTGICLCLQVALPLAIIGWSVIVAFSGYIHLFYYRKNNLPSIFQTKPSMKVCAFESVQS